MKVDWTVETMVVMRVEMKADMMVQTTVETMVGLKVA